jgi:DNA topoisomerase-3
MDIAEKLYMKGLISYPRTETDSFPKDFDFMDLIRKQRGDPAWGQHAERLSGDQGFFVLPKNGHHDDKAHPPIHPTNYSNQFESREQQLVYELVVRHFLACCSGDALADETIVTIDMGGETFTNSGSLIHLRIFSICTHSCFQGLSFDNAIIWRSIVMKHGMIEPHQFLTKENSTLQASCVCAME